MRLSGRSLIMLTKNRKPQPASNPLRPARKGWTTWMRRGTPGSEAVCRVTGAVLAAWSFSAAAMAQERAAVEVVANVPHSHFMVDAIAISRDDTLVLSGSADATVKMWEASTGRLIRTFTGREDPIEAVAFSPSNVHVLAIVRGRRSSDLMMWEAATGKLVCRVADRSGIFSPDGHYLLASDLRLFDAQTGGLVRTLEGEKSETSSIAFSDDGTWVVSSHWSGALNIWEAGTGRLLRAIKTARGGQSAAARTVAVSPDKTHLLFAGTDSLGEVLELRDALTGAIIRRFDGYKGAPAAVFSPDGSHVLSLGPENKIGVWDRLTGRPVRTLPAGEATFFKTIDRSASAHRSRHGPVRPREGG